MDATTLRIILIIVGALLLLLLYLWERRRMRRWYGDDYDEDAGEQYYDVPDDDDFDQRELQREPVLGEPDDDDAVFADRYHGDDGRRDPLPSHPTRSGRPVGAGEGRGADTGADAGSSVGMIVQVYVVAAGRPFPGDRLVATAARHGLFPGDMGIFHRRKDEGGHSVALFSMANLVDPGTFPFAAMRDFQTRGVVLFAQLAGTPSDLLIFDELVQVATALADHLGGVLQRQDRSRLDQRQLRQLRAQISAGIGQRADPFADATD